MYLDLFAPFNEHASLVSHFQKCNSCYIIRYFYCTSTSSVLNNAIEKNQAMLEGQGEVQKKLLKVLDDTAAGPPKNSLESVDSDAERERKE